MQFTGGWSSLRFCSEALRNKVWYLQQAGVPRVIVPGSPLDLVIEARSGLAFGDYQNIVLTIMKLFWSKFSELLARCVPIVSIGANAAFGYLHEHNNTWTHVADDIFGGHGASLYNMVATELRHP